MAFGMKLSLADVPDAIVTTEVLLEFAGGEDEGS